MAGRASRGQAPAISVAILTAITLALAVALYAYFSGHIARTGTESALLDVLATVTENVDTHISAYTSNSTATRHLYCYAISISNAAGADLRVYLTVLPVARVGSDHVVVSPAIERVPLDSTIAPPPQTAFLYLLEDYDRDGVVEVVGKDAAGNPVAVGGDPRMPSCHDIYSNNTVKAYDLPYFTALASDIYLLVGGASLQEQAQIQVNTTAQLEVPLWEQLLPALGKKDVFIYIESPVRLTKLSLVVLIPFNDLYYAALIVQLPTE